MERLPSTPGTYTLHLSLPRPRSLEIGRLGEIFFPAGEYVYIGSAFGPGGLRARLGRHLAGKGHPHWHIDALRAVATVRGFCYAVTAQPLECPWSQALATLPQARIPAPGFGASDCRAGCLAHLVTFPPGLDLDGLGKILAAVAGVPVRSGTFETK